MPLDYAPVPRVSADFLTFALCSLLLVGCGESGEAPPRTPSEPLRGGGDYARTEQLLLAASGVQQALSTSDVPGLMAHFDQSALVSRATGDRMEILHATSEALGAAFDAMGPVTFESQGLPTRLSERGDASVGFRLAELGEASPLLTMRFTHAEGRWRLVPEAVDALVSFSSEVAEILAGR